MVKVSGEGMRSTEPFLLLLIRVGVTRRGGSDNSFADKHQLNNVQSRCCNCYTTSWRDERVTS